LATLAISQAAVAWEYLPCQTSFSWAPKGLKANVVGQGPDEGPSQIPSKSFCLYERTESFGRFQKLLLEI
jgi:hypothetical protein